MKKIFISSLAFLYACSTVTQEELDRRFADIDKRLGQIEDRQRRIEEQSIRTETRLDSTVESLTKLRFEVEKLKGQEVTIPTTKLPKVQEQILQPTQEIRPKDDVEREYEEALKLYDMRQLNQAKERFIDFIKRYPNTSLTDNAYLWLGVIYRDLREVNKAEAVWMTLVEKCRRKELIDCNKAPSVLVQLARVYEQKGDQIKANEFYDTILREYPASEETEIARKKLGR